MVSFTTRPLYPWGKELSTPIGEEIGRIFRAGLDDMEKR
jgi:hypothetical protein